MECNLEKECNALGGLFQSVINEMKNSAPAWEDLGVKAVKLSVQLKTTIAALNQFLDALQKISDYATSTKGATRDIGTALTRICMRHRSMENRLKTVSSALIDCFVLPLQEHGDDWRQRACNLDKDHAREYKKTKSEIRKRASDTLRLQKKVRKGENRMQPMLDSAVNEMNERYTSLLENERRMCRSALIEQRSQFCYFVSWFKPILDLELGLLEEASHLREVTELLCKHSSEPNSLPPSSEAVIYDARGLEHTWAQQFVSPPSSPSSLGSRKSSFCSLSSNESSVQPLHYAQRQNSALNSHYRVPPPQFARHQTGVVNGRFMASHDSGIATSNDVIYAPVSDHGSSGSSERERRPPVVAAVLSQQSTPSPSPSAVTWPDDVPALHLNSRHNGGGQQQQSMHVVSPNATPRPHTISAGDGSRGQHRQRTPLATCVFDPPTALNRPATLGLERTTAAIYRENNGKPPLPAKSRQSTTPSLTPTPTHCGPRSSVPPIIPDFNAIQPDQFMPQHGIYANISQQSTGGRHQQQRRQRSGSSDGAGRRGRPLSFVGDTEDMHRLLQAAGMALNVHQHDDRWSLASGEVSHSGSSATMSTREDDQDTLIEEALGQIDRLTTDLDSYCLGEAAAYCTLPRQQRSINGVATAVRWRPPNYSDRAFNSTLSKPQSRDPTASRGDSASIYSTATGSGSSDRCSFKPRPPVRRNSSITAATPTAPSVEVLRNSSRCTTPVEDYHDGAMYAVSSRVLPTSAAPSPYTVPFARGSSEPPSDQFSVTHETLLLQIRNGVCLRRTPYCSDRSVPRV